MNKFDNIIQDQIPANCNDGRAQVIEFTSIANEQPARRAYQSTGSGQVIEFNSIRNRPDDDPEPPLAA